MVRCRPGPICPRAPAGIWVPALRRIARGGALHRVRDTEGLVHPFIPTISGLIPAGYRKPLAIPARMWYLAGASFDRHTRPARFAPKGPRRWRYFAL